MDESSSKENIIKMLQDSAPKRPISSEQKFRNNLVDTMANIAKGTDRDARYFFVYNKIMYQSGDNYVSDKWYYNYENGYYLRFKIHDEKMPSEICKLMKDYYHDVFPGNDSTVVFVVKLRDL